jgi:hypothetical protein
VEEDSLESFFGPITTASLLVRPIPLPDNRTVMAEEITIAVRSYISDSGGDTSDQVKGMLTSLARAGGHLKIRGTGFGDIDVGAGGARSSRINSAARCPAGTKKRHSSRGTFSGGPITFIHFLNAGNILRGGTTMTEWLKCFNMKGFDRYHSPRWQMVPVDDVDVRYVLLRDGTGLTVTSQDKTTVDVTEVKIVDLPSQGRESFHAKDRFFKLHGIKKGATKIVASGTGVPDVVLEVEAKDKKKVALGFNFVTDTASPRPHTTTRAPAATTEWLKRINFIYNGQANIFFRQTRAVGVTVEKDLGPVVRWAKGIPGVPASEHEWDVVIAKGDSTADMNFFFVWEYEQGADPTVDGADAGTLGANCIFEDHAGSQVAESMAHEIGHFLGRPDHYVSARKREVMYGITDQRGWHLPKEDVNVMNP